MLTESETFQERSFPREMNCLVLEETRIIFAPFPSSLPRQSQGVGLMFSGTFARHEALKGVTTSSHGASANSVDLLSTSVVVRSDQTSSRAEVHTRMLYTGPRAIGDRQLQGRARSCFASACMVARKVDQISFLQMRTSSFDLALPRPKSLLRCPNKR